MKKIAWITDSTCGLSQEFINKHNIYVLPLNVIINGKSYKEDIDITKEEFYSLLRDYGEGAKTSQPAYGDFIQLYEKLKQEYDCGIAVHASSELTGTYQSSISASEMVGFPVEVIDSKIGAYPLGKMIEKGIRLEQEGIVFKKIVSEMKTYPDKATMYLLPENLEQLRKSGRVSTTQSVFASLMHINLILGFEHGKVVVKEKVRSKKKATRKLLSYIDDAIETHQLSEICIMHAGVKEQAQKWKVELESMHQELKIKIETLVPVAGVHTGYGTLSIAWLKDF